VGETISIRLMHSLPDHGPLSGETTEKPETHRRFSSRRHNLERLVRADPRQFSHLSGVRVQFSGLRGGRRGSQLEETPNSIGILVALVTLPLSAASAEPTLEWVAQYHGASPFSSDMVADLISDAVGNTYVTGQTQLPTGRQVATTVSHAQGSEAVRLTVVR
jgi:hypothetical protein